MKWTLIQGTDASVEKKERDTERRRPPEDEAEVGGMQPHAREHLGCQRLEQIRKDPPWSFGGSVALLTLWFLTSSLQTERINFSCFKPPTLWCFVVAYPRKLI